VIVDYHMHLRNRGEEEPAGRYLRDRVDLYVEQAARAGVDEIGFTDHVYHFAQSRHLWEIPWMLERCTDDLDEFVATVEDAKRQDLPVKLGIEVDYFPGLEEGLAELLAPYDWDYVLGSVHYVDGLAIDQEPSLIGAVGVEEGWSRYFDRLAQAAGSGLFDVLSHPDLVKFFGKRPADVSPLHAALLDAAAEWDVCLEVSAAGLDKPVGELYPDPELLRGAHGRGIPITLASDAHVPEHVGRDLASAVELARASGYETVSVFDGGERRQEPLG